MCCFGNCLFKILLLLAVVGLVVLVYLIVAFGDK